MGAPGGKRYTGPFKCAAQIAMERRMTSSVPGMVRFERCSYYGCGKLLPKETVSGVNTVEYSAAVKKVVEQAVALWKGKGMEADDTSLCVVAIPH